MQDAYQVGEEAQRNCPGSWIIGDPLPLDCLLVGGIPEGESVSRKHSSQRMSNVRWVESSGYSPAVAVDPNVLLSCRLGSWRGQVLSQGGRLVQENVTSGTDNQSQRLWSRWAFSTLQQYKMQQIPGSRSTGSYRNSDRHQPPCLGPRTALAPAPTPRCCSAWRKCTASPI